jgi:hypothetical protein
LSVQKGVFPANDGSAEQYNEDFSAGNIQINVGIEGTQYAHDGYSFNLQYNIIECKNPRKYQVSTLRGNIRVVTCYENFQGDIYHYTGDVVYKIYNRACYNEEFMEVRDGKIYIKFCIDV